MICPEGYISFRDLMDRRPKKAVEIARQHYKRVLSLSSISSDHLFLADAGMKGLETVEDALERILMWGSSGELRVFHPKKGMLRLSLGAMHTYLGSHDCSIFDILDHEISFRESLAYNLVHEETARRLYSEDESILALEWSDFFHAQASECHLYNHFRVPWWHERLAYKIDLSVYDRFRNAGLKFVDYSPFDGVADILRGVSGGTLCLPEHFVSDVLDEKILEIGSERQFTDRLLRSSEGPHSRRVIFDDFKAVCPEGKESSGLTWLQIEEKTGWSRRSIDRAIKEYGGQEDGQ